MPEVIEISLVINVLTFVVLCGAAGGVLWKMLTPLRNMRQEVYTRMKILDERTAALEDKSLKDYHSIQRQETVNKVMLKSQLAVLAHLEEGNNTNQMHAARESISDFLVDKF